MSNLREQMANLLNQPQTPPPTSSSESEERPLLRSFPNPSRYGPQIPIKTHTSSIPARLHEYLTSDIETRWAELPLLMCFFISGMIDAGAYNAYECFCSMQTGNTVFAALGVSNLPAASPKLAWTKSVASVLAFLLGAVVTAYFHRAFGDRKRWVLSSSFLLQSLLIVLAGVMVNSGHSSGAPGSESIPADPGFPWIDLVPISLLAFQAAAKVIASRALEYSALPCIVLTTLYADLVADPSFFTAGLFGNAQRNRRVSAALTYFVGAVLGGVAAATAIGFSGGLFVAAGLQIVTAVAFLLWRADESDVDEDEEGIAPGSFG